MRFLLFIIILLNLPLLACSRGKIRKPATAGEEAVLFNHPKEFAHLLKGGEVYCKGNCPEYAGAFYLFHNERRVNGYIYHDVKLCSATLIAKDKVLTNRHCIENIISEGESCSKSVQIQIKFPTGEPLRPDIYDCDKILKTSSYFAKNLAPDWAIIKLRRMANREPVKIDRDQAVEGASVSLFPVYFDKSFKPAVGVIQEVNCNRRLNDNVNIFAFDDSAPLFKLTSCSQAIPNGNSGVGAITAETETLLGVMASSGKTTEGIWEINGTMAHCLPGFGFSDQSCFFSDDQNYINAARQISFLNHLSSTIHITNINERLQEIAPQWLWQEETFSKDFDHKTNSFKLDIDLKSPWLDQANYLQDRDKKLYRKYINSIKRLHFPKHPICLKQELADNQLFFPVIKIDWSLGFQQWQEVFLSKKMPSTITAPDWRDVKPQVEMLPVAIISKNSLGVILQSSGGDLPSPLNNFQIKVSYCK